MTTSYENDAAAIGSSRQPNYNAEGMQVWNPEVGIYHKPAFGQAESYGGIVGALQDLVVESNLVPKSYPHNFAGIIAAIQDLKFGTSEAPVIPGPNPGNGVIQPGPDGNDNWVETYPAPDGTLWFDTRQGKLFVSIDEKWYQTNGADGIPYVTTESTPPAVPQPVPGQFWWDSSQNDLYIFDGLYQTDGGDFTIDPNAGRPVWKLITDGLADAFQTTMTLPLGALGPKLAAIDDFNYITPPDIDNTDVQAHYNVWLFNALEELDTAIFEKSAVVVDDQKPDDPKVGDFWYDTESLELSIWYDDGNTQQWVPTSAAYSHDNDIATLTTRIASEEQQRDRAVNALYTSLNELRDRETPGLADLQSKVAQLQNHVDNHPQDVDLSPYATRADLLSKVSELSQSINNAKATIPAAGSYTTATQFSSLSDAVDALPTTSDVNASIAAAQPDLSNYVTQAEIDQSISNITTEYLPRTGGTLSGSFVVQKEDMAHPAFDFSSETWYSHNTHKYATNGPGNYFTTFGTNQKAWEYAWDFRSNEDFCWIYNDTNKVFSITKDGPACSTLILGDFGPNNNDTGRVIRNKIDLKDRLTHYQFAFESMRQGVANATDFDSLKANILSALANV